MQPTRSNVSDIQKLPSPSLIVNPALAGTRQGWYERACQHGLDGFRSNAEHVWEEGEGSGFDGARPDVTDCLTPAFVGQVLTISSEPSICWFAYDPDGLLKAVPPFFQFTRWLVDTNENRCSLKEHTQ